MNRRHFLTAGAGVAGMALAPEAVYAAVAGQRADWALAVADVEADMPRTPMRLVQGRAPAQLSGVLYRNGPARFHRAGGDAGHWFDGDGLLRAFRISDDGQATLEARFADTPKRRRDTAAGAVITPGFGTSAGPGAVVGSNDDTNAANTSVLAVGGELWSLWESGSPTVMDSQTLRTKGFKVLRPDMAAMPFLAHPRVETGGRVWNLGLNGAKAVVWNIAPDGTLDAAALIDLPRASYIHDFTATDRHLVIVLQPWIQDRLTLPEVASLSWRPDLGTQVLVVDKADLSKRRLYDLPAFFTFHMGDAWAERDGTIRFDICIDSDPSFAIQGGADIIKGVYKPADDGPTLAMVSLHPDGRGVLERTAVGAEFPRSDRRFAGVERRFSVHTAIPGEGHPLFEGLAVHDWRRQTQQSFGFGPRHLVEEALFVPRPGSAAEFDGWLVGPSVNLDARASELHVFDAQHVDAGPICTWRADRVLPVGFHGFFVQA
jgi:all-trans-8'-apo-beta-carotenal 15,15'-oxygenase